MPKHTLTMKLRVPSDYEIIGYVKDHRGDEYVACFLPDNEPTPYVTWLTNTPRNEAEKGSFCHLGHYFDNRELAMADLFERAH